jgi:hypothetical protein
MKTSIKKNETTRVKPQDRDRSERKQELTKKNQPEEKPKRVWNPSALYF